MCRNNGEIKGVCLNPFILTYTWLSWHFSWEKKVIKNDFNWVPYILLLFCLARGFPTINNGDTIALRWAHTSYITWLMCSHGTTCKRNTCPGRYMTNSNWHNCPRVGFHIIAWNKKKGEPINSGDTIVLSPVFERHPRWRQGYAYYMYCNSQCQRFVSLKCIRTHDQKEVCQQATCIGLLLGKLEAWLIERLTRQLWVVPMTLLTVDQWLRPPFGNQVYKFFLYTFSSNII